MADNQTTSTIAAIIGWIAACHQWLKKRKAELELKNIQRRGDAPYLVPSNTAFNQLYMSMGGGQIKSNMAGNGNLLCFLKDEAAKDSAAGTLIRFVVENSGKDARRIVLLLDGEAIALKHEPELNGAHHLSYLEYPYDPAKHGKVQQLVISFETDTGFQDKHTYLTKHGFRILTRQDPL